MPNPVGAIPEFTQDETQEEVKPVVAPLEDETTEEETETPAESSSENQPVGEINPIISVEQTKEPGDEVVVQLNALQLERHRLLREISELKGQKRDIKQQELFKVQDTIDEIEGVDPEDVKRMEAVLKKRGYVTQEEAHKMFYDSTKDTVLNQFLDKHPEYKPENDPGDLNWQTLNRELALYKMPTDPHRIAEILDRAHKSVRPLQSAPKQNIPAVKRQLEVASVGSGGAQQSSSSKTLNARYKDELIRGGWTEEDIKNIESNL